MASRNQFYLKKWGSGREIVLSSNGSTILGREHAEGDKRCAKRQVEVSVESGSTFITFLGKNPMYIRRQDDKRREFFPRNLKVPLHIGDGFTLILDDHLFVLSRQGHETPQFTSLTTRQTPHASTSPPSNDPFAFPDRINDSLDYTSKKRPTPTDTTSLSTQPSATKRHKTSETESFSKPSSTSSNSDGDAHVINLDGTAEDDLEDERRKRKKQEEEDEAMAKKLQQQLDEEERESALASKVSITGSSTTTFSTQERQEPPRRLLPGTFQQSASTYSSSSRKPLSSLNTSRSTNVAIQNTDMEQDSMLDMENMYSSAEPANSLPSSSKSSASTQKHGLAPKSQNGFIPAPDWAQRAASSKTSSSLAPGLPPVLSSRNLTTSSQRPTHGLTPSASKRSDPLPGSYLSHLAQTQQSQNRKSNKSSERNEVTIQDSQDGDEQQQDDMDRSGELTTISDDEEETILNNLHPTASTTHRRRKPLR